MADVRFESLAAMLAAKDKCGKTLAHHAALEGDVAVLEFVARAAPETLEAHDKSYCTPLHLAAGRGHLGAARALARLAPATLGMHDNMGDPPLHSAARGGHPEVMEFLFPLTPDVDLPDTLQCSAWGGLAALRALMRLAPDLPLDTRCYHEMTAMHTAAWQGRDDVVRFLARAAPGTLEAVDGDLRTPLHMAAEDGRASTIELLARLAPRALEAGNSVRDTPLHSAAEGGHVEAIELLARLAPGTLEARGVFGDTPLHVAARLAHVGAIELLARLAPGTLDALDEDGRTPLDHANHRNLGHPIARHVPLTSRQWEALRCPARELEALLPAVLRRSRAEAACLMRRASGEFRARVRTVLLCAHRRGVPSDLVELALL